MSEIDIFMGDLDTSIDYTDKEAELIDRMEELIYRYLTMIMNEAINNTPIKTGLTASSYSIEFDDVDSYSIVNSCPYFPYVEARFGMLASAWELYGPQLDAEIDATVEEVMQSD